jgi:hypothetical protein
MTGVQMNYRGFKIETFEIGRYLWHARFGRDDHRPILIDDVEFPFLNVGMAWPTSEAAISDARAFIDSMIGRMSYPPIEAASR